MKNFQVSFMVILFLFIGGMIHAQKIMSKDGVEVGDRAEFISSCISSVEESFGGVEGLTVDAEGYCACVIDGLFPQLESEVIFEALLSEIGVVDLLLAEDNLNVISECLESTAVMSDSYVFDSRNMNDIQRRIAIQSCVYEFMADEDSYPMEVAEVYCACAIDRLYEMGVSLGDINYIEDENSEVYQKVVLPCVEETLHYVYLMEKEAKSLYNQETILGDKQVEKVKLTRKKENDYYVKLSFGSVSDKFLIDTQTEDVLINEKFEKKLLKKKVISEDSYFGKTELKVSGYTIKGKLIYISEVKIGGYTVKDVMVGLIEDGPLVCGKNFLSRFRDWDLEGAEKKLYLYR